MDATATSTPLSIQRGPNCLIVRVDDEHRRSESPLHLVDRLLAALESHSLKSVVVETGDCTDRLLSELASLQDCVCDRGGSVKLVNNLASGEALVAKEDSRIPVYPDLNAAFFAHRSARG